MTEFKPGDAVWAFVRVGMGFTGWRMQWIKTKIVGYEPDGKANVFRIKRRRTTQLGARYVEARNIRPRDPALRGADRPE